ncbi:MAG: holo-ACP synthase [Acholeplasmataceae bacterium]
MIKGIGTDIVSIERITDERFIERVLAPEEQRIYRSITDINRRKTFLAGRFAAKEALFKALDPIGEANYRDFIILNDEQGKPFVRSIHLTRADTVHLSIAHTRTYATAFVIVEGT